MQPSSAHETRRQQSGTATSAPGGCHRNHQIPTEGIGGMRATCVFQVGDGGAGTRTQSQHRPANAGASGIAKHTNFRATARVLFVDPSHLCLTFVKSAPRRLLCRDGRRFRGDGAADTRRHTTFGGSLPSQARPLAIVRPCMRRITSSAWNVKR